ncbi:hypothetical protein LSH36_54g05035 [Paralvinella palmiformis]|uniref:ER membrane protein complex subunit 7 beta-sandwich domain-containing protein n=1 Tax=Paralvinella palmiformis TaxID=53620 RepID=A0AAD9NFD0_9ANNE|nr:hypothetical protein LSH36_54g05035 [Paralvinella palmiformis]
MNILCVTSLFVLFSYGLGNPDQDENQSSGRYHIEGKVSVPFVNNQDWISSTRILIDGGDYIGFLKSDGTFSVTNVPSGSYVVEVNSPDYVFETYRVDINSKGKLRARRVNHIQPSAVNTVIYPLKFKARAVANYFQQREQWRITDLLYSPMVMMMVLPFLMIMVLPKLMNTADPEAQKDFQNQMNLLNAKQNMPELSELVTSWLGGGQAKKSSKPKALKKR